MSPSSLNPFRETSVPGKTFLVGEYLALDGGPAILLTTEPRFVLRATKLRRSSAQRPHTFAGASPAGRLFVRHEADFQDCQFRFDDPHRGAGGLGASSAQFALLYTWLMKTAKVEIAKFDWQSLLDEYRACAWNGEGQPPSGADVVAQLAGGVCWFDARGERALGERLAWGFPGLAFTLIRTGVKLATHEHLKRAKIAPYAELRAIVDLARLAFMEKNSSKLVESVKAYGQTLSDAGLTAEGTLGLISALRAQAKGVLAAKGCGAMGADVVAVLHERSEAAGVRAWARSKGLEICGDFERLSADGLRTQ